MRSTHRRISSGLIEQPVRVSLTFLGQQSEQLDAYAERSNERRGKCHAFVRERLLLGCGPVIGTAAFTQAYRVSE